VDVAQKICLNSNWERWLIVDTEKCQRNSGIVNLNIGSMFLEFYSWLLADSIWMTQKVCEGLARNDEGFALPLGIGGNVH